ncbi:MAG: aspartate--tRNA ligase [Clostridia bacterium]|jgi:aspartyl-tRNA synthetase|nr:aspartate--tRNA ligase [Clostridia bacterium]
MNRTHKCGHINESLVNNEVTISGWLDSRRNLGGLIFTYIRDISGNVQVVFDEDVIGTEGFELAGKLRNEFVVQIKGDVVMREEKDFNLDVATGKVEIHAKELIILSEAETPPFHIEEGTKVNEELRLKYRYMDLRRPDVQRNFILRHKVYQSVRNFFSNNEFLEVETPMLTKSTPEGARDYLVPSRVHDEKFYALPQSPQIFKQLLMVSGFDRYFQITKCFRDEDLRADRQPEFTQIDTEMSFVDVDDVLEIHERHIKQLFKDTVGVDVQLPIQRMTFKEAMERYGSDKPDIRFGMELQNISELVKDSEFGVFSGAIANGGSVRGINAKGCGNYGRKQIDKLVDFVKDYRAKGLAWIAITEEGEVKSQISKFFSEEELKAIIERMDGQNGDLLLFCADKDSVVFDSLGALRLHIAKQLEILDPKEFKFLWVTEFPLFEYDEDNDRYAAMHHPFTMVMDEDLELLEKDPLKARAKAYDVTLNGYEIGGGSIRIHKRDIQEKMFAALGFSKEEAEAQFGFLMNAFKYGTPPHGGLAYGLDRIVMLMLGENNIRNVIAFPKTKEASCLMTDAPSVVDTKQLDELGITIKKED